MKKNMSGADRMIRLILAIAVIALYYFNVIDGTLAYILMALAAIFVITSFVSFCPLYTLIGLNTSKGKKD